MLSVVATKTKSPDAKERTMFTSKPCAMLMLAVVAAGSLHTAAQAQQVNEMQSLLPSAAAVIL